MRVYLRTAAVGVALAFGVCATASAASFAPLEKPGPKLSSLGHSKADLRASLECTGDLGSTKKRPVLLLSGTTVDPDENFAWNWMPALSDAGYAWCAQTAPEADNMEDIQARGEYIVYALRKMARVSGRKVVMFGHSQGGMVGRWALRFWPDVRRLVSDVVGAAPSNRGTDSAIPLCAVPCAPAFWQQRTGAEFLAALNSRTETFPEIDYTNVYTQLDAIVFPNLNGERASLDGGENVANVAAQSICAANVSDHLILGTIDPVAWALFIDAITHRGPADPARIDPSVCSELLMPGADPETFATDLAAAGAALATVVATHPRTPAEPELKPYVFKD